MMQVLQAGFIISGDAFPYASIASQSFTIDPGLRKFRSILLGHRRKTLIPRVPSVCPGCSFLAFSGNAFNTAVRHKNRPPRAMAFSAAQGRPWIVT
jgi:hypothetical protein